MLTASYTDRGAAGLPPLTGEVKSIFHARNKRAALFDHSHGVTVMEVSTLVRQRRICVQFGAESYVVFRQMNLANIQRIDVEISASTGHGGLLELRADSPTGPLIGHVDIPETGQWENWKTLQVPVTDPGGLHDLYAVSAAVPGGGKKRFNLDTLHFVARTLSEE